MVAVTELGMLVFKTPQATKIFLLIHILVDYKNSINNSIYKYNLLELDNNRRKYFIFRSINTKY